jgi:hypothetical protein
MEKVAKNVGDFCNFLKKNIPKCENSFNLVTLNIKRCLADLPVHRNYFQFKTMTSQHESESRRRLSKGKAGISRM